MTMMGIYKAEREKEDQTGIEKKREEKPAAL